MTPERERLATEVLTAMQASDAAIQAMFEAMVLADKNDGRTIAMLRQKYSIPQKLAAVAECNATVATALGALFRDLQAD